MGSDENYSNFSSVVNGRAIKTVSITGKLHVSKIGESQSRIEPMFFWLLLLLIAFIWRYSTLSRIDSLRTCRMWYRSSFFGVSEAPRIFYIHESGVLIALFGCCMAGATWNCCRLGASSEYTIQPYTRVSLKLLNGLILATCLSTPQKQNTWCLRHPRSVK